MKAVLDHIGIPLHDLAAALAFYRDALGLEIEPSPEGASPPVLARFVPAGKSTLEPVEAGAAESPLATVVSRQGPCLHHITLRVEDIQAALAEVKSRGARLVDETPRRGEKGSLVAFIHPTSARGVLVELQQSTVERGQPAGASLARSAAPGTPHPSPVRRYPLGDLELISVCDGFFRLDGGAMFGVVPKSLWEPKATPDERNRITLAMRPLIVRGRRTMIIDAGVGDKENAKFHEIYALDRRRHLDHTLAEAGLGVNDIDIVLATHLHFDHAGGFTKRDADGRVRPRFPRAQYIVRRGEWDDATHPNERNRASYLADNYLPLAEAGVLQLVDDDLTIMPGVRVHRTGGHTMHHQMVIIESGGQAAVFVAELIPTVAHVPDPWIMGYDLFPLDTLSAKKAFVKDAIERKMLIFFEHDPATAAGYITEENGKRRIVPA